MEVIYLQNDSEIARVTINSYLPTVYNRLRRYGQGDKLP